MRRFHRRVSFRVLRVMRKLRNTNLFAAGQSHCLSVHNASGCLAQHLETQENKIILSDHTNTRGLVILWLNEYHLYSGISHRGYRLMC